MALPRAPLAACLALSASLSLMACHEGGEATDATAEGAFDPTAAEPIYPPLPAPIAPAVVPPTQLAVARTLKFAREADGISLGFDLDDRVSDRSDGESCRQRDFVAPDGTEGIDNAFARLLPLIEAVGGTALEGLVQSAINEGDLLVMVEMDGIDSLERDDDVTVTLFRGLGQPYVGTDGFVEPWQTYDVDALAPWSRAEGATIRDGVLEAGPVALQLPIYVFDFEFLVTVTDARVRIALGEDGPQSAVLGGVILMQNLLDIANNIEGGQNIPGTLDTVGRAFADMQPNGDGTCAALSVALDIDLAGAFFYDDVERPDR